MYELLIMSIPPLLFGGAALIEVGPETSAINGEVPNMTIAVDNARGEHTQAVAAVDVLRERGELRLNGALVFAGAVQSVVLGAAIEIALEA